ncbi:MAG: ABC transporter ATP-binding protein, partial [Gemmatimonadota bacterium]
GIAYEDVWFAYDHAEPVLRGISFEVRKGEVVALVGPSGGGKTTIVDLLPRFYSPTAGRVAIDGVDTREVSLRSLRATMGIVSQETILFHDTVRANVAYGRASDYRQAEIEAAARTANAHDFIAALPQGYDTVIGERGVRLSGGQRQRLAITRAILRDPPILIFDEATSALDTESERLVQEAIARLLAHRTVMVIAHRLSTVQNADRILVVDGGRIVERGRHADLLARGGLYRRLYELQFEAPADAGAL